VNLVIYADESGTHHPKGEQPKSEVPVIAGYMGWRSNWKQFCHDWKAVLDRHSVPFFHAKEFERRQEPYQSWSDDRAERFKYALAEIAGRNTPVGGSYHIKEHYKENPEDETYPYKFPIRYFFSDLVASLKEFGFLEQEISIVFDSTTNKKWMAAMAEEIETLKTSGIKICSHVYGDDKDYLPLQAADMLAYRSRERHFEKLQKQIETKKLTGNDKFTYLRPTIFDIVLCRNLHPPGIGFKPELNDEIKKEVSELAQKHPPVKRALREVPHNYFKLNKKQKK
jgi:hypothetical protein